MGDVIKILFDSQTYDRQRFGGISRMFVDIYNELNKDKGFNASFSVEKTRNVHLSGIKPFEEGYIENMPYSIKKLKESDFDVFYPTFFNSYFLEYLNNKPFVMSVHDMIPEIYPEYFQKDNIQIIGKRELVKYASAIEVPTNTTKKDLIRILNVQEDKIHVIGRGLTDGFGDNASDNPIVDFEYILYVGRRGAYKRFNLFVKHIKPYLDRNKNINVFCTGYGFDENDYKVINEYGLSERFYNSYVDDAQLASLYKFAKCFVYPSEYEGFGIPILEAYKMGCPVLLNNNECFREVTFGKGCYFNLKEDKSDLSDKLEFVTVDNDYTRLRDEILSKYNWKNSVNKLKYVFRKVQ